MVSVVPVPLDVQLVKDLIKMNALHAKIFIFSLKELVPNVTRHA